MLRVGKRGKNKWKRISWDEAIDLISHKLMETRENYGAEALFCSTGGGNPKIWSKRGKNWVFFERKMSFGVGKCGHCKIGGTYVCLDGPVFNYKDAKGKLID